MIRNSQMQDQVHNRIEELMNEKKDDHIDWDEIFQNVTTLSLIIVFISLGFNW